VGATATLDSGCLDSRLDGHEFVELLPEDFTKEEYDYLLDEFIVSGGGP
jgi:hypothetical protein